MIDTDKARRELEGAHVTPEEVEAHLNIIRMQDREYRENLATKNDLDKLEIALASDIEKLEERLLRVMNKRLAVTGFSVILAILAGVWGILELYLG